MRVFWIVTGFAKGFVRERVVKFMSWFRSDGTLCTRRGKAEVRKGRKGRKGGGGKNRGRMNRRVGGSLVLPVTVLALGSPRMNERRAPSGEGMNEMAKVFCVRGRGQEGRESQ